VSKPAISEGWVAARMSLRDSARYHMENIAWRNVIVRRGHTHCPGARGGIKFLMMVASVVTS
jgi:hypothetical protein